MVSGSDVRRIRAGFEFRLRCLGHSNLARIAIFLTVPVDLSRKGVRVNGEPLSICRKPGRALGKAIRCSPSGRLLLCIL
jgi:hypothetical protein